MAASATTLRVFVHAESSAHRPVFTDAVNARRGAPAARLDYFHGSGPPSRPAAAAYAAGWRTAAAAHAACWRASALGCLRATPPT